MLSTLYIKWTSPSILRGRPTRTQAGDRRALVYPTPANPMYKEQSFVSTEDTVYRCIHPAIGVRVAKEKTSGLRSTVTVPEDIDKLRDMWEAAQAASSESGSIAAVDYKCGDGMFTAVGCPILCPVCLLPWHDLCAGGLSRAAADAGWAMPDKIANFELPARFTRHVSVVCRCPAAAVESPGRPGRCQSAMSHEMQAPCIAPRRLRRTSSCWSSSTPLRAGRALSQK